MATRDDEDGAQLTRKLVEATRVRLEHSLGMLSVRRALLYDPRAGVTDRDVGRWLARGSELEAAGAQPVTEYDRLCVELTRMDSARGGVELVRAGMAARRILDSRDPRAYSAQVRLIGLLQHTFADRDAGDQRHVGVSQEDMDSMSAEQLEHFEALLAERARVSSKIDAVVESVRRGRVLAAGDERLH